MANVDKDLSAATRWRAARCGPFVAVALCFLLPFFSASSCGSGRETTATGVDIVVGTKLVAQQTMRPLLGPTTELGPVGPDAEAQEVSRASRPWAIIALILTVLGAALVIGRQWYWHAASMLAAAAALYAVLKIGSTLHAPEQDISADSGLILAGVILFSTALWRACTLAAIEVPAVRRQVSQPAADHPVVDLRRGLDGEVANAGSAPVESARLQVNNQPCTTRTPVDG